MTTDAVCEVLSSYRKLHGHYGALHSALFHQMEAAREAQRQNKQTISSLKQENAMLGEQVADATSRANEAQERADEVQKQLTATQKLLATAQQECNARRLKMGLLNLIRRFHPDKTTCSSLSPTDITAALNDLLEMI